jgi:hypothetical protein
LTNQLSGEEQKKLNILDNPVKPFERYQWLIDWQKNSNDIVTHYLNADSLKIIEGLMFASDLIDHYIKTKEPIKLDISVSALQTSEDSNSDISE